MKLFNRLKQEHPMFFVSLLWLVFPIYYSLDGAYPSFMLPATILFAVFHIGNLIIINKLALNLMWLYMCIYIVVINTYVLSFNVMLTMFLSSLLNFKFMDTDLKSFRNITFYSTLFIVSMLIVYNNSVNPYFKTMIAMVLGVAVFSHVASRIDVIDTRARYEKMKQHEYINSLLAENERNRIARDLHDSLGHIFVSLNLKSELAVKYINKGLYEEAAKEISEINKASKIHMKQVREIVSNISYKSLKEEVEIAKETLSLAGIEVRFADNFSETTLSKTEESTLVMLIKELVNNILKHSEAAKADFILEESKDTLTLVVSDNGKGFESKYVELKNMKERLLVVGGSVEISSIKEPTIIKISIPRERM
ncbi:MAG: sensor histidine kinase [Gemella sp.]|nr:sensor histidine kinase [Gemella sp.]